jgi:hypothetical protein
MAPYTTDVRSIAHHAGQTIVVVAAEKHVLELGCAIHGLPDDRNDRIGCNWLAGWLACNEIVTETA